jgi:glycosyltransferase involved in cell wall biosynthesis
MRGGADDLVVGIDASRMALKQRTGTENYSYRIIRGLLDEDVSWCWRLYLNALVGELPISTPPCTDVRPLSARRLWTHYRLSREMLTNRPNVLFVPAHVVPVVHPRTVVTIHDLGYLHTPEAHPTGQRRMLDLTTRWSAKTAHHIIAPSTRTQQDLIEHYNVPESRISVIYHGVDTRFRDIDQSRETDLRSRYGLHRPYVLAVGTIHPRKNLAVLAQAMVRADLDHDLVVAGKRGWMADGVLSELHAAGLGDRLRLLDYVPDAVLPDLYAAADIFVQPSRFEGFGMPVLEAMAAGTPVLCAAGSSLSEIAGDAALFFEPDDTQALAKHLESLPGNRKQYEQLREYGLAWSSRFTWERAARETRSIVEKALT